MGGNVVHDVATPVAGTDAANKAYVDTTYGSLASKSYVDTGLSALNSRVNRVEQGVAMAMAVQNPVLTGSDRFGFAVNWGNYAGNDSVGLAAVGIIGQNFFGSGEKVGMTGGFSTSGNQVAGRAGLQFTW
jgi:outer membrane protein assembly factor BamA